MSTIDPQASYTEITTLSKHLEQNIHSKEIDSDAQRIGTIVTKIMPQLIEDIAKHPEHADTWKHISTLLKQAGPQKYQDVHVRVDKMVRIGTTLSQPVEKIIQQLDADLSSCINSLRESQNLEKEIDFTSSLLIEENLKFAALLLTNHLKLFRGVKPSDGTNLTHGQLDQLGNVLQKFKNALNQIESKQVSAHPFFEKVQRLIKTLETHDYLGVVLSQIPKVKVLGEFSEPTQTSLDRIRDLIVKNPKDGYIALAEWINTNQLRVSDWNFTKQELQRIQPHLRYVNIQKWSQEECWEFLSKCPKIETLVICSDKVTQLPPSESLRTLNCSGCVNLKALPPYPALDTLNCMRCLTLTKLSNMPALSTLDCRHCRELTTLPDLPALTELVCEFCDKLTDLGQKPLPALTVLNCQNCYALRNLETLPALKILNCSDCRFTELPYLPQLEELDCYGCKALEQFGDLSNLKKLDCRYCPFKALPHMPRLEYLSCQWFPGLIALEELQSLKKLYLYNSQELTALPRLPALEWVSCENCNNLQTLAEQPALKFLNCTGCSLLEALPSLPSLEELSCGRCRSLPALGQMPKLRYLDCNRCTNLTALPSLPSLERLDCTWCHFAVLEEFPKLKRLDCLYCKELTTVRAMPDLEELSCTASDTLEIIDDLPALKKLACLSCRDLTMLPSFSNLERLNCEGCPNLRQIGLLPNLKKVDWQDCPSLKLTEEQQKQFNFLAQEREKNF